MKFFKYLFVLTSVLCLAFGAGSCQKSLDALPDGGQFSPDDDKDGEDGNDDNNRLNDEFVMLFTNDFHSQIEPNDNGRGGVLRMKALVDSVRAAEPHVLLADAGDLVQGTYYFSLLNAQGTRVGRLGTAQRNQMGYV